jgi:A/G-specific adenine glycosylase
MNQALGKKSPLRRVPPKRDIAFFRKGIFLWSREHLRRYPWRETRDPYKVLLAEMMLRRTKAEQVKPVYDRMLVDYPNPRKLADAEPTSVEKVVYPLGLSWRTPAFTMMARDVTERYGGKVPETREDLKTLPGVGDYVAGAVLSIAYGQKEWIVDSNIVRVFKRYFGMQTSKEGRRDAHVIETAKMYCSARDPRRANLAILDFAATVCIPRTPRCDACLLTTTCSYYKTLWS